MAVTSEDPDLDTGHLQSVNGVGNAILELVLDGGRAEEEEVALDELGSLVQGLATSVDRRGGFVVDRDPLAVLLLRDVARGYAERPETFGGVVL